MSTLHATARDINRLMIDVVPKFRDPMGARMDGKRQARQMQIGCISGPEMECTTALWTAKSDPCSASPVTLVCASLSRGAVHKGAVPSPTTPQVVGALQRLSNATRQGGRIAPCSRNRVAA